jgi:flagellar biosynthesis protein FlhB
MSQGEEDGEKEHAPSQKRLEDARRQGDVAKSTELSAAAAYGGLLLAGAFGLGSLGVAAQSGVVLLDQAPDIAQLMTGSAHAVLARLLASALVPLLLFLGLPALLTLITLLAQRSIVVAPNKLRPKLSRISPLSIAKQKFGIDGLFEFGKSFVKLLLVGSILGWFLMRNADEILATAGLDPRLSLAVLYDLLGRFLFLVIAMTGVIGAGDYLWQRQALIRRNRMSRKDILDEMKESEGDPHTKATRRQRGQDLAMNQMIAEVARANVVIVNPTHYAVALRWTRGSRTAPILVAKGVDDVARRIRDKAAEHGVPIHADPPTARALHATVEIGKAIQPDHYRAVAVAIRFSEAMRKRARGAMR